MIPTGKPLESWYDTATRRTLVDFVERVTQQGTPGFVPVAERVAVFDNDGTLWCEKPMPIQLDFIVHRLAHMAERVSTLRDRQPWRAAYEKDYEWLGQAITRHYEGDNGELLVLMAGVRLAFGGMSVDEYESDVDVFLRSARHPTLGRPYIDCVYRPMVELLDYLEGNGFTTYIASGGDRDFMRPATRHLYGIPRERVIGSSFALHFKEGKNGGSVMYKPEIEFFDDGPEKPVRIWSRVGRRPILAVGNSNGDVEMLQFAGGVSGPVLRLLLLHDDREREFDYKAGAERSLEQANAQGWTVISMRNDWASVFGDIRAAEGARNAA
jgi:phosphoglycolate phosphatase-like HAD superfamily hydrolase